MRSNTTSYISPQNSTPYRWDQKRRVTAHPKTAHLVGNIKAQSYRSSSNSTYFTGKKKKSYSSLPKTHLTGMIKHVLQLTSTNILQLGRLPKSVEIYINFALKHGILKVIQWYYSMCCFISTQRQYYIRWTPQISKRTVWPYTLEIKHLVHWLFRKGTGASFWWTPSQCGLTF